jgi:hypothetical protein
MCYGSNALPFTERSPYTLHRTLSKNHEEGIRKGSRNMLNVYIINCSNIIDSVCCVLVDFFVEMVALGCVLGSQTHR